MNDLDGATKMLGDNIVPSLFTLAWGDLYGCPVGATFVFANRADAKKSRASSRAIGNPPSPIEIVRWIEIKKGRGRGRSEEEKCQARSESLE